MVSPEEHQRQWIALERAFASAMWSWAEIEAGTFTIYLAAVGGLTMDMRPIRASFFSVNSFEVRLSMTHAAVQQRWGKQGHGKTWIDLHVRCDKARKQRNKIAHVSGRYVAPQEPHQHPLYILSDPFWHHRAPRTWGESKSIGINASTLTTFSETWNRLSYDLSQFGNVLWSEGLQAASPPPQAGQPHQPPSTDGQIHEEPE